jgi:hypothetical protein
MDEIRRENADRHIYRLLAAYKNELMQSGVDIKKNDRLLQPYLIDQSSENGL